VSTIDDMTSGLPDRDAEQIRVALRDIAALSHEPAPPASAEVLALLSGGVSRRVVRHRALVAAAAGALAFGGTSVAAASNNLPTKAQEAIADFADEHLPVTVPHPTDDAPSSTPVKPVKPTNAPYDAPGHVRNKPKAPIPAPTTPPGQVQKLTKPDPHLPGPAKPADPGSHGKAKAADARADKADKADKAEQADTAKGPKKK
jgi:type IV secretory pathway VirB10-like protein